MNLQTGFYTFVNSFRVTEAKELLESNRHVARGISAGLEVKKLPSGFRQMTIRIFLSILSPDMTKIRNAILHSKYINIKDSKIIVRNNTCINDIFY